MSGTPYAPFTDEGGENNLMQTQRQVDEVVEVMKDNMNKVLDRDVKLGDLEDKSSFLEESALRFQTKSTTLRKKMWWQDKNWTIGIVVVSEMHGLAWVP